MCQFQVSYSVEGGGGKRAVETSAECDVLSVARATAFAVANSLHLATHHRRSLCAARVACDLTIHLENLDRQSCTRRWVRCPSTVLHYHGCAVRVPVVAIRTTRYEKTLSCYCATVFESISAPGLWTMWIIPARPCRSPQGSSIRRSSTTPNRGWPNPIGKTGA